MKKHFKTFIISLVSFMAVPIVAVASAAPTQVAGTITIDGHTSTNALVIVTCNGHAKRDRSDLNGNYFVQFTAAQCPVGSSLNVTATKGNRGGVTNKKVTGSVTTANVAVVTTTAVPELGTVTGIGALVAAAGAFLVIRKRQTAQLAATIA